MLNLRNATILPNDILGLGIDLWRLARNTVRTPHGVLKFRIINEVRKATGATLFVETGTFHGQMAWRASKVFDRVVTIELAKELAAAAQDRFRSSPTIEVCCGDSRALLQTTLGRADIDRVVVFLDGHFSGGITAGVENPCLALDELRVLRAHAEKICGVVLDDFRLFGVDHGWPTKAELLNRLEADWSRDFDIRIELDQVVLQRRRPSIKPH